jgi:L-alanine-DL-glutamate epimerase-like enolase superfamily enzyme
MSSHPRIQGDPSAGRAPFILSGGKSTDIRLTAVRTRFSDYRYRTPIKFGGVAVDSITLLDVECEVVTRAGKVATGFGSMPLANTWAFPSRRVPQQRALQAMRRLVERCAAVCEGLGECGHPIELGLSLEERFLHEAKGVSQEMELAEPVPKLCTLVCGSAFDAALHDAFGKAHHLNCYHTYGRDFVNRDLGVWLGAEYAGKWPEDYVKREPVPRLPLYHLVGALDPLDEGEVVHRVGDGWPETLAQWIRYSGLTHLKIKLNGDDLGWDLARIVKVDLVASEIQRSRGVASWVYSLDFNERCENVEYLLALIRKLQEQAPHAFKRVQYIEQPTARDLAANPHNRMHEAARLKPVVIDESLVDLESLMLARELGYTGAALKACKGQSQSLLMAAAAHKMGLFLCVQDLTCPGASLIQSAGIAAHVTGVAGIEANARQYCPAANVGWTDRFPGVFDIRDGHVDTGQLRGEGLGALPANLIQSNFVGAHPRPITFEAK